MPEEALCHVGVLQLAALTLQRASSCSSGATSSARNCSSLLRQMRIGPNSAPDADNLLAQLRAIKISDDTAVLADMSAKLKRCGIFAIEELQGLSMDELKEAMVTLNLNAVQLRRLFAAVPKP